jgi:DNA mismatch endonuclease (patch repair protein)
MGKMVKKAASKASAKAAEPVVKGLRDGSRPAKRKSPKKKDRLSKKARSALMAKIHGRDTEPELIMAGFLRRHGIYLCRHAADLPGRPDFVFRRCRMAVFIDGEFWHGHDYRKWKGGLSPFWRAKIEKNMARDRATDGRLRTMGWLPVHVWGRDVLRDVEGCGRRILTVRARRSRQAADKRG